MRHHLAALIIGIAAFTLISAPNPAGADPRLAAGLAGLGKQTAPVEQVRYYGRGHRGYGRGYHRGYSRGYYRGYRRSYHRGYGRRHYRGYRRYGFRGYRRHGYRRHYGYRGYHGYRRYRY